MDLVELIGQQISLKAIPTAPKHHRGNCPFCGTGQTLCVYTNQGGKPKWYCHYCKQSGDGIDWLRLQGMSFRQAQAAVATNHKAFFFNQADPIPTPPWQPKPITTPCEQWQKRMGRFIRWAQGNLTGAAMAYLHERGIDGTTATRFGLGYNPQRWSLPAGGFGLTDKQTIVIDQGLVIPTWRSGLLVSVKIRLAQPWRNGQTETRYHILAGSRPAAMILDNGLAQWLVTESELDLVMLTSIGLQSFNLAAFGAAGTKPDQELDCMLQKSKRIMIAFDNDNAGKMAGCWWVKQYPQAIRLKPLEKDVGEMFCAGGAGAVLSWIKTPTQKHRDAAKTVSGHLAGNRCH